MQPASNNEAVHGNTNNIRVQIQTQAGQNVRPGMPPQAVHILNAPGAAASPGGMVSAAAPRITSTGQPVTLIQGPRGAGAPLQRVVIRPHNLAAPGGQQYGVRPIAPAPRPSTTFQHPGTQPSPAVQPSVQLIPNSNSPAGIQPRPIPAPNPVRLTAAANVEIGLNRPSIGLQPRPRFTSLESTVPNVKLKSPELLDRSRIQDLVNEVDPNQELDEDVQNLLLEIADDFIEKTINTSCQIAQHRNASTLETSDVQLCLERNYNMWIPGFSDGNSTDDSSSISQLFTKGANASARKNLGNEAHKQRMAVLRKTLKK